MACAACVLSSMDEALRKTFKLCVLRFPSYWSLRIWSLCFKPECLNNKGAIWCSIYLSVANQIYMQLDVLMELFIYSETKSSNQLCFLSLYCSEMDSVVIHKGCSFHETVLSRTTLYGRMLTIMYSKLQGEEYNLRFLVNI